MRVVLKGIHKVKERPRPRANVFKDGLGSVRQALHSVGEAPPRWPQR